MQRPRHEPIQDGLLVHDNSNFAEAIFNKRTRTVDYPYGKRNMNFIPLSLHIQKSVLGGKMKSAILKQTNKKR